MNSNVQTEKTRLLILTSSYPSVSDVVSQSFMTDLAESLSKKNIDVFVICPHLSGLPHREERNTITIIRFPYWFIPSGQKLCATGGITSSLNTSLLAYMQLIPFCICQFLIALRTIKRERIDIIHSHWILPQGMIGALIRMITGIPHITSIHGTDIHLVHTRKVFHPFMKMIAYYSQYITANSSHTHRLFMEVISSTQTKTAIIPMGIHPEQFSGQSYVKKKKRITILFVGRLIQWKGVTYLIHAIKLVISRGWDVHLNIIGNGPEKEELQQFTHTLGIPSNVHFLGNMERKQLLSQYKNADLFVLPSIVYKNQTEGLGVVLLEAMASGVPVIGSNIGGIPDIIKDDVNGLLVPPGDPQALADAIIRILKNPDLAERFRKAGQETVRDRFSWDVITDQFVEVYQEILKESHHE